MPTMTQAEIDAVEAAVGVGLPALYRQLLAALGYPADAQRLHACGTRRPDSRYRGVTEPAGRETLLTRPSDSAVFGAVYFQDCRFRQSTAGAGSI